MQGILRYSNKDHGRPTAYNPKMNGLTELLNKKIADMLSLYVDVEQKTWDKVLSYVTSCFREDL